MNNNVRAINTMNNHTEYSPSRPSRMLRRPAWIGFEKTVSAINSSVSAAGAAFEKGQAQVKQSMDKAMKTAEELVSFSQGNYEAFVKSSQIWAAGLQDLSKQIAATAQAQIEETMAAMKSFGGSEVAEGNRRHADLAGPRLDGEGDDRERPSDRRLDQAGRADHGPADRPRDPGRREVLQSRSENTDRAILCRQTGSSHETAKGPGFSGNVPGLPLAIWQPRSD